MSVIYKCGYVKWECFANEKLKFCHFNDPSIKLFKHAILCN